jgi:hypothetical protein
MTSPPDADAVRKALALADQRARTGEDTAFLRQFYADHLQPRAGEDPAAHAARLPTPELFRLYRHLRDDTDVAPAVTYALAPVPAPVPVAAPEGHEARAARILAERAPAASSHGDFVDLDEDYTPAVHPGRAGPDVGRESESPAPVEEPPAARPHSQAGAAKTLSGVPGLRRKVSDWVHSHKLATGFLSAAVLIAAGSFGTMYVINWQAERASGPVRQKQQNTGKAADALGNDPGRPFEPKSLPASRSTVPGGTGR